MMQLEFTAGAVPMLVVTADGFRPTSVALQGRRAIAVGSVSATGDTWRAKVPLHVSRWGGPVLPLPSGRYELMLDGAPTEIATSHPRVALGEMDAEVVDGRVSVSAPADDAPLPPRGILDRVLGPRGFGPLRDTVFFESFYGRNASCNPRAIDAELARLAPDVTRYWSVVDHSVAVPDGAVPVIEGSAAWHRARSTSRLLVVNDWLRHGFVRRRGQRVLQTWHGTPLKRLALHRAGFDPRRSVAIVRESLRWSVLLAQNPFAAGILARAYAFVGRPVWVEGYPRNDVLIDGDGRAVRDALGIDHEQRVLLYAPTWRDDREQMVDFLDVERLARDVDAVVLVRGHSRTLIPGTDARGARVIDVTGYPDIAELLLVADGLITDYSSVMFDYSATGKPIYVFAPDLEHYRGELRGFYFDLAERVPGPMTATHDELTAALTDAAVPTRFAERAAAWRARFNARDDGRAAERVVARLLDQGMIRSGR
ncbi:CDP-glycerol glycerophosphotransferase family protein [Microbacterium dauci]|uniref:CDP-glycerol glycerophosphotransferase family protein n=1 Tax=Microbacterium dauci TaxID=3048008 RepID=A0ABT6ZCZ5_9MICO|nr:CDP-glycerol glycerophosphotransferase family protein [Microbacterium sp. LX3-4]MDJ1113522.1 CDP-glycerol glycerophosphotransferase family protein [Microbacterium sp. LX3-4]